MKSVVFLNSPNHESALNTKESDVYRTSTQRKSQVWIQSMVSTRPSQKDMVANIYKVQDQLRRHGTLVPLVRMDSAICILEGRFHEGRNKACLWSTVTTSSDPRGGSGGHSTI